MTTTPLEERARARAKALTDLLWHIGAYIIVNAFMWTLDGITDGHITWAFWMTIPWGLGLAFHALAWYIDGRDIEARATDKYLHEMQEHDRVPEHHGS